ncbi:PEP-CTERM sorting domain-containing protein [bacterium]|nr:PEP-CTERM sorting domain-containing protein [bacterium]
MRTILITIITIVICLAPAFAGIEDILPAGEPVIAEQVLQEPLELASEPNFEITPGPVESAPVDYSVQAYEIQPAQTAPLAQVASTQANAPATCVVYKTQSSSPECGFIPSGSGVLGAVPPPPVPEPSSMLALMTGIGGIILRPWKRRK